MKRLHKQVEDCIKKMNTSTKQIQSDENEEIKTRLNTMDRWSQLKFTRQKKGSHMTFTTSCD